MRQYQPVWERLKERKKARLVAAPAQHANIKRMVSKEKDMDTAFKLLCSEAGTKYKLDVQIKGTVITFRLVSTIPAHRL